MYLIKFFPKGKAWENENLEKFIKSIEATSFFYLDKIIEKTKIFNENYLDNWNFYLNIPDGVFFLDGIKDYEKFLIKLNKKRNKVVNIIEDMKKIGINVEVLQNGNNFIQLKVISDFDINEGSFLETDIELDLTGATASSNQRAKIIVERYLEKILIATSNYEVLID